MAVQITSHDVPLVASFKAHTGFDKRQVDIWLVHDDDNAVQYFNNFGEAHRSYDDPRLITVYTDRPDILISSLNIDRSDSIEKFTREAMRAPSIQQFWTDNQERLKKLGWARSGWDY